MKQPNLVVTVAGGKHSGKSELAKAVLKALRKNPLYGTAFQDGETCLDYDNGPVKVLVHTEERENRLSPEPLQIQVAEPEMIGVTKDDPKEAFLRWELHHRKHGGNISQEERLKLPAGQVAEEAALFFWKMLSATD